MTEDRDAERTRTRLSPEERRRQLLGIGLRMLVEKPIQDLPLDAVAAEAGISRGLLFHYFPTKTDYYDAVIAAALRRVLRNISPDEGAAQDEALHQFVDRFYAQIERRRSFYLALVFGNGSLSLGGDGVDTHRMTIARRVVTATGLPEAALPVAHGWTAYVEDRALRWSGLPSDARADRDTEVDHACRALHALLALDGPDGENR
ncbi:TetR/AcrR family transcriptional regulator [Nocardioides cavernaquae]|uniref:TetR/AcrR family transcriptional regulator n=1 Tax=Nocardioides cavernaquae TaxID=2321396 RepID=UPI001EE57311|nr:TetR/AcrR family transcriptional regulator [Nocardioides cavernaquae]